MKEKERGNIPVWEKKNKRLEQLNAMCNPGLDSEPENKFPSFSMEEIQPGSEDPIVLQ